MDNNSSDGDAAPNAANNFQTGAYFSCANILRDWLFFANRYLCPYSDACVFLSQLKGSSRCAASFIVAIGTLFLPIEKNKALVMNLMIAR